MKKLLFYLLITFLASSIFGSIQYVDDQQGVRVHYKNDEKLSDIKSVTEIIAVASKSVVINVKNCRISEFDKNNNFIGIRNINGNERVQVEDSFTMRELFGHKVRIDRIKESDQKVSIIETMEFDIVKKDPVNIPNTVSSAFLPIYNKIAKNYATSYLNGLNTSLSKMLIITHESLINSLQPFIEWKNARGIATEIATISEVGSTNSAIKSYIQNIYDTEDSPPDYILLIGDIDDDFVIPSFYIHSGSEDDVTDQPYTMLEGDDYFPEMLIGRMSIDQPFELQTMIAKILSYEKEPFMQSDHWYKNATVIAGNYSPTPPSPTTPVKVSKWAKDKMIDYGYNEIDEYYYWPPYYNVYPGTSAIGSSISDGVGVVSYRGWGDANGWHYPIYHADDIEDLNNGYMLPIIASFVCNTGDFASSVDPCFGEKWLRAGNPSNPKGGVIFVGPSDLHTSTKYNNSIYSGFISGIFDEDILTFSSALLRGKMELYNNFPLQHGPGEDVEFYFHVYNVLGDPSLQVRTQVPQLINCDLPDEVSIGSNYLDIDLSGLDGAVVTAIKADEFFATEIVENGSASIYLDSQTEGVIEVTITKENYYPFTHSIDVIADDIDLALEGVETDSEPVAGDEIDLSISLKNNGSQIANSVSGVLSSENENVTIITTSADFGDIASDEIVTQDFTVSISADCPDNEIIEFSLDLSNGQDLKFELVVNSLVFEISNISLSNDYLQPETESDIIIEITNHGSFTGEDIIGELSSALDVITITSSTDNFGDIPIDGSAQATFSVAVSEDAYIGQTVEFQLELIDLNNRITTSHFNLEIGDIDETAPSGPDSFGYYCYDSKDVMYTESPNYQWIEIDPLEGGSGFVFELGDDRSETISLPMNFKYYDQIVDSLTICTNGWISFEPTWETSFRNWNIPSALGPYGMIAAYWDDLIGELNGDDHNDMRICYYYDEQENTFIIEWNKCVNREDDISVEKFEIILYDPEYYSTESGNGEIQINYYEVNNPDADGNYCTVGIENFTQSDGLLYTYANLYPASAAPLEDGLAIKFTTDEPEYESLVPEFTSDVTLGIVPLEVTFENQTYPLSEDNQYEWDFGDGSAISNDVDPTHIYNEIGNYTVTLTVTNLDETETITKDNYIQAVSQIYPGDTDNNGIVNEDDILPIGVFWRENGNARDQVGFDWIANDYPEQWDNILAPYADCNGDGEVSISDVLGICLNWGETHTTSQSVSPQIEDIVFEHQNEFIELYHALENNGSQLIMKNLIAERFDLPTVTPAPKDLLYTNYPNPFNPKTTIQYSLSSEPKNADLKIYNIKGQLVRNYSLTKQNGNVVWNGRDQHDNKISSGIYFYKLVNDSKTIDTKKMLLVK